MKTEKIVHINLNTKHLKLLFVICLINSVIGNDLKGLEWTDPDTKTYYNIASLKKDPK
jgi:hypothetical protein